MKLTSSAGKFDGASFSAFALEHLQMGGSGAKPCCFALAVLPACQWPVVREKLDSLVSMVGFGMSTSAFVAL